MSAKRVAFASAVAFPIRKFRVAREQECVRIPGRPVRKLGWNLHENLHEGPGTDKTWVVRALQDSAVFYRRVSRAVRIDASDDA